MMKTEKPKTKSEVVVFKDMNTNPAVKQGKKLIAGIKTEAFGDKENLMKKGVISYSSSNLKSKLSEIEEATKKPTSKYADNITSEETVAETKIVESDESVKKSTCKKLTAEDLTCEAGPSEAYWEVLAEKRRQALEEALVENYDLHAKIESLKEENESLKQALSEAVEVIDALNEILKEEEEESTEDLQKSDEENGTGESKSSEKSPVESVFGDESSIVGETDDSDKE